MTNDLTWISMKPEDLPLKKTWIKKMTDLPHDKILILIERESKGGSTKESTCPMSEGLEKMMLLPTHRICFIGQCADGHITATFRWISKQNLDQVTGLKHPDTGTMPDLEWVSQLPCFPKWLAINEIPQELDQATKDLWCKDRGLDPKIKRYDCPVSKDGSEVNKDPDLWIIA